MSLTWLRQISLAAVALATAAGSLLYGDSPFSPPGASGMVPAVRAAIVAAYTPMSDPSARDRTTTSQWNVGWLWGAEGTALCDRELARRVGQGVSWLRATGSVVGGPRILSVETPSWTTEQVVPDDGGVFIAGQMRVVLRQTSVGIFQEPAWSRDRVHAFLAHLIPVHGRWCVDSLTDSNLDDDLSGY